MRRHLRLIQQVPLDCIRNHFGSSFNYSFPLDAHEWILRVVSDVVCNCKSFVSVACPDVAPEVHELTMGYMLHDSASSDCCCASWWSC